MGKVSSGLESPAFYDWNRALKEALDRERFDIVVAVMGANDAHNSLGTQSWGRLYESKFSEFLRIVAEKHVKTLVVGLPPMRASDFSQRVQVANDGMRNAARLFPETCTYVDSFRYFSDGDGNFADVIRLNGEWKKVRAKDGVHFTGTGYLAFSSMIVDAALRQTATFVPGESSASAGAVQKAPGYESPR
jgi:hypothetical protein